MKTIIKKPHFFFFGLIPFFILIAIIYYNATINFIISNSFFTVGVKYWCLLAAFFVGVIGLNYKTLRWIKKQPNKKLTLLHLILQTSALVLFVLFLINSLQNNVLNKILPITIDYYVIFSNALFLFMASIIIHMINFFQSLLLKSNK